METDFLASGNHFLPFSDTLATDSFIFPFNGNVFVNHNHGHNILRLFDTLPNVLFTTNETKRDY